MKKILTALAVAALVLVPASAAEAATKYAYVWDWSASACSTYLNGKTTWVFDSRTGYRTLCTYPVR